MSLVDPTRQEARVTTRRTTRSTVVVSLVLHVVVLGAVVVVPLVGEVTLPGSSDSSIPSFVVAVATPRVPPPPAMASRTSARAADTTAPPASPPKETTSVPLDAPDRLPASEAPTYVPGAQLAGDATRSALGGVDRGLPGPPAIGAPPPPSPPVRLPLRVGGDITPPRKLQHVAPVYPGIAAHARIAGTVVLEATISRSGLVSDVRVLRSVPLLDAAAIEAVRQWRYEPPRLNGEPVSVLLTVTVHFGE